MNILRRLRSLPRPTALPTALRTVIAAALVVLAGAGIVRLVGAAFDPFEPHPGHTADYGVERPVAIRAALPSIAERPEHVAIVLGSSGIGQAFVPDTFDAALSHAGKPYVSFNLAQLVFQPETALAMAKVIRHTFEARNKRSGMTLFAVSVPELTRDGLRTARRKMPAQAFAFANADVLEDRMRTDPLGALGDGLELALFGNVRPERLGAWTEDWIAARPPGCNSGLKQPPDGKAAYDALVDYCNELQTQFPRGVPPWNPRTRGGFDFGLPATRPMLERLVDLQPPPAPPPPFSAVRLDPSRKTPDDIDEGAVRMVIAALRELEAVSESTFVLRALVNPAVLASLPPDQVARWNAVAERIAHEADARLLDLNDGAFAPSDFGDGTHLNPLAAQRFSARLATRVRPLVQESHASR
jgi:hypothetical protein